MEYYFKDRTGKEKKFRAAKYNFKMEDLLMVQLKMPPELLGRDATSFDVKPDYDFLDIVVSEGLKIIFPNQDLSLDWEGQIEDLKMVFRDLVYKRTEILLDCYARESAEEIKIYNLQHEILENSIKGNYRHKEEVNKMLNKGGKIFLFYNHKEGKEVVFLPKKYTFKTEDVIRKRFGEKVFEGDIGIAEYRYDFKIHKLSVEEDFPQLLDGDFTGIEWDEQPYETILEVYHHFIFYKKRCSLERNIEQLTKEMELFQQKVDFMSTKEKKEALKTIGIKRDEKVDEYLRNYEKRTGKKIL